MSEMMTGRSYARFVGYDACQFCGVDVEQPCIDQRYLGKTRKIGFGKNQRIVPITKVQPHRGRPKLPVAVVKPSPTAARLTMLCIGYGPCLRCGAPPDQPCLNMHYLKKYPKEAIDTTKTPHYVRSVPHRRRPRSAQ